MWLESYTWKLLNYSCQYFPKLLIVKLYGSYIIDFWVVFDSRVDFFIYFPLKCFLLLASLFSFYFLNCLGILLGDVSSTAFPISVFPMVSSEAHYLLKKYAEWQRADSATFSVTSLLPSAASLDSSGRKTLGIRFLRRSMVITKKYRLMTHNAGLKHKLAAVHLSQSSVVLCLLLLTGQWHLKSACIRLNAWFLCPKSMVSFYPS